jgi:hypothetical protein
VQRHDTERNATQRDNIQDKDTQQEGFKCDNHHKQCITMVSHYAECCNAECCNAECCNAECQVSFIVMLNVFILSFVMLNVIKLNVLKLCHKGFIFL